ncbi:hypothetical protein ACODT3_34790 [Streptomyces sp. 4.24]|uniref:hypothetical protein n=1 Tax=Streptomyces tritrimontium TaxID=3406573 RepID=UPI003BB63111
MSTRRWLRISLQRYVLTALLGWTAAALVQPAMGTDPFWDSFGLGMKVGLLMVPLLTVVTTAVLALLAGRRFEPPTGGAQRIRGGWLIVLPLLLPLPVAALTVPLQYLIVLGAQVVYLLWVLPCTDARDTADRLRSLADPAVPAADRAGTARSVAGFRSRPAVEALVGVAADKEPEVAEAALETLCTMWRRDGVVGEDLLLKLDPRAQDRVRGLGIKVRSPW